MVSTPVDKNNAIFSFLEDMKRMNADRSSEFKQSFDRFALRMIRREISHSFYTDAKFHFQTSIDQCSTPVCELLYSQKTRQKHQLFTYQI